MGKVSNCSRTVKSLLIQSVALPVRTAQYFCDYCDVFLTHDSASVRRAHNAGRNHLTNVKDYYSSLGHDKAQDLIDQITKMYDSGGPPAARPFPNAPSGMAGMGMGPPMGMMGGPPPHMMGGGQMGGPPMRPPMMNGGGPPQGFNPQFQGGNPPPMHFGQGPPPPQFMGQQGGQFGGAPPMAMPPPPGFRPPPGFFGAPGGGPGGPTLSAGPSMNAPMGGGPEGGRSIGMNPERARLLGLI